MRREYQPASPIVKIVKQTPALAPEDSSDAEHHAVLMHKFFRAHGKEVANSPKKKQRKALGKLWRESPLNPKNARVQQDYESANGAPGNGDDDRDVDEEVGEGSAGDEAKIDDEDEHSTM
ncbi:hypothetical protein UCDDS831_g06805 [Diplodia seriata]|uniref:Uncharacterized protein n=1 Tax=Diplodia seriata TaxID=420778 RepID=A0A0G2E313_9PEZI|nr:hypothetical protein UCDDS831_g06805 [Diplodia seriata]